MEVTIPPNSTATIYVPVAVKHGENGLGEGATGVMVNGRVLAEAEYVTFSEMEKQIAVLEVESGTYVISSPQ
jgi:hypothetical protein